MNSDSGMLNTDSGKSKKVFSLKPESVFNLNQNRCSDSARMGVQVEPEYAHDKSIKHQAANAVSTALRGDIDKSKQIFKNISNRVTNEYDLIQKGRILYLSGAFALAATFVLLAVIFYIFRHDEWVKNVSEIKYMIYASAFSGFGGILSVCTSIQKIEFERDSAKYLFYIYGLQRILISSLCGVLGYALVKGDFIFSFILKADNPTLGIMVVCAVAGFSETLIPNALKKIESQEG